MSGSECFQLGGSIVRIDWADENLQQALGPALRRRLVPAAEPALTIRAGTGRAEWTDWTVPPAGGLVVSHDAAGLRLIDPLRRLAHWIDAAGTRAEFLCEFPEKLPVHERAAPFRLILQRWLETRRVTLLHAGAVGLPDQGAVLLAARSGGGKSNTTLACLAESNLQVLGEDFVAMGLEGLPRVWSLYNTAKLLPEDLPRYPSLVSDAEPMIDRTDDKAVLQLGTQHAARWADGLPLRGILVLEIAGTTESRIVPAAPAEAVKAMLTSLLMILPDTRRQLFADTTALVRKVPVHRLKAGRDPRQLAQAIQQFLAPARP